MLPTDLRCTMLNYTVSSELRSTLTELPPYIKFSRMPELRTVRHPVSLVPEWKEVPYRNHSGTGIRRPSPVPDWDDECRMPMPSYDHGQPYARVDLKPMPESTSSPSQGLRIGPRIYVSTLESSQGFCYKDIAFIMYELMRPSSGRVIYIHYTL